MHQNFFNHPDNKRDSLLRQYHPFKTTQEPRSQFRFNAYSDRFIPSRPSNAPLESLTLGGLLVASTAANNNTTNEAEHSPVPPDSAATQSISNYTSLLESQIFSDDTFSYPLSRSYGLSLTSLATNSEQAQKATPSKSPRSILRYKNCRQSRNNIENLSPNLPRNQCNVDPLDSVENSKANKPRPTRKIAKIPYKILDAPSLVDDFYLNLLDWSSSNHISIGLQHAVYIWSAVTNKATKLHETATTESTICSVAWNQPSTYLAIGESNGRVKIYDVESGKMTREMLGHTSRVGSISWNGNLLSTGSRDKSILTRDMRESSNYIYKLTGHQQEICGVKWSADGNYIASGGNDNKVFIWSHKNQGEIAQFTEHTAAVKALAWSPHQHNILATGGGKSDKTIKFWNLSTMKKIDSIETGSQVCNMTFSTNSNELLSTHGYSMNEICVWSYPTMQKLATLTGHTSRVLYLGMSPDGENIVSGAGDETLRFWNVFPSRKSKNDDVYGRCCVNPSSLDLR